MSAKIHAEFRGYGSASPGICWLCHQSRRPDDVVVDLGRNIDMEGDVQVCGTCVKYLGSLVGMADVAAVERLKRQVANAKEKQKDAEGRLNELVAQVLALGSANA